MGSETVNVFQLLVTAIVAVVFLGLVYQFVIPIFAGNNASLSDSISKQLDAAQTLEGKATSFRVNFLQGEGFDARAFDTKSRSAKFECNLPSLCCEGTSNCTKAIGVSPDRMTVNQNVSATVSTRCKLDHGLEVCQIIVGEAPAQIEMSNFLYEKKLQLFNTHNQTASFDIKNTGKLEADGIAIVGELRKQNSSDILLTVKKQLATILAGGGENVSIDFENLLDGNYTIDVSADSTNAGSGKIELNFEATGQASLCTTMNKDPSAFNSFSGKCEQKLNCKHCQFAFECADQWKKLNGLNLNEELGTQNYAVNVFDPKNGNECS